MHLESASVYLIEMRGHSRRTSAYFRSFFTPTPPQRMSPFRWHTLWRYLHWVTTLKLSLECIYWKIRPTFETPLESAKGRIKRILLFWRIFPRRRYTPFVENNSSFPNFLKKCSFVLRWSFGCETNFIWYGIFNFIITQNLIVVHFCDH